MLKWGTSCSMSARLASTAAGNAFLQPLDLHVEPADPLVEFGLEGLALLPLAMAVVAEEGLGAVEESLLPLADLDRMDLIHPGQFGDGPGLLGGLQGDLGLEGSRMPLAFAGHDAPRDGSAIFDQYNIPSCPVSGVHPTHCRVSVTPNRQRLVEIGGGSNASSGVEVMPGAAVAVSQEGLRRSAMGN